MGFISKIILAFQHGGIFMWPILFTSFLGAALTFERVRYMRQASSVRKEDFLNQLNQLILQGNLERCIALCNQSQTPLTKIVRAGLMAIASRKTVDEVQTAMDAVALREIPKIEKRTALLALLANMGTLLGLLGTTVGMIGAFAAVATAAPSEKAAKLAAEISEAMNCTAFGLLVAIPLLAVYGWLTSRGTEIVDDVHEAAVATLNFIISNRDKFAR
ncbi:MAG: MotA/TolQ/ExbB proton channel family protein [Bdellovibrionales bacterium]|jgi:biopolymer transport protein ExbB/TolQ|nr:MotA/TolQ/ExbB proton channel family protein [Bdellovibrionales bacterium]